MPFHYDKRTVIWLFRIENFSVKKPSQKRLKKFDCDLNKAYEETLKKKMKRVNIPFSLKSKSFILALAYVSKGSKVRRVQKACAFYKHLEKIGLLS